MTKPIGLSLADQVNEYKQQKIKQLREMLLLIRKEEVTLESSYKKERFYALVQAIAISFQVLENPEKILNEAVFKSIALINEQHIEDFENSPTAKNVFHIHG